MLTDIRRIGRSLEVSEGGLLKIGRDISENGALVSLSHLTRGQQRNMLEFLRQIASAQYQAREGMDRACA